MRDLWSQDYQYSLGAAIVLHILIMFALFFETHSTQPVLRSESAQSIESPAEEIADNTPQAIQAVSVDEAQVMQAVNQLKQERAAEQAAEKNRQQALQKQAELARQQRVNEQQQLLQLKREAAKLAAAREKQMQEEKKHLQELAHLKQQEEQKLAAMKKQAVEFEKQQAAKKALALKEQAKKVTDLQQKHVIEQANAQKAQLAAKMHADALAAQKKAQEAHMAGEVDKYKAMILGAISRQWILPDNANSALSSQFRIHLAPNGAVLAVSLIRSSGDPVLDRSAQSAIYKASPLPVPTDVTAFNLFRDIRLTVRPGNARG